jgi:hypothetical protein
MDVAMKSRTSRMATLTLLAVAFAGSLVATAHAPESFGATIAAEIPKWAETVRAAGIRLD